MQPEGRKTCRPQAESRFRAGQDGAAANGGWLRHPQRRSAARVTCVLLGVIRALACSQPECGPLPPRPPHVRPCRRGRAAPSRRGPYASEHKIHLPRSPGKEDLRPADSRCGAPGSGCDGRLAGALTAGSRQAASRIQPGTASSKPPAETLAVPTVERPWRGGHAPAIPVLTSFSFFCRVRLPAGRSTTVSRLRGCPGRLEFR